MTQTFSKKSNPCVPGKFITDTLKNTSGVIDMRPKNGSDFNSVIYDIECDNLNIQLEKLFDLYNVRKDLYNVAQENLEAANLNMQISRDKFRAGTINSFNYRDVQLIYLNASFNRLNTIYNLIDANTALMKITGGIISEY